MTRQKAIKALFDTVPKKQGVRIYMNTNSVVRLVGEKLKDEIFIKGFYYDKENNNKYYLV